MIAIFSTASGSEPVDEEVRWNRAIETFVNVIAGEGDAGDLSTVSAPGAWIAPFDLNRTESLSLLPERLATKTVVSARAYIHPSVSSASDIVADLVAAGTIDAETLRRFTPEDPADLRRADATMARWFASALDARGGDPVAIVVLYDDGNAEPIHTPAIHFVLVRGESDPANNPRVVRVLYGPASSALK